MSMVLPGVPNGTVSMGVTTLSLLAFLPVAPQSFTCATCKSGARLRVTRENPLAQAVKRKEFPLDERTCKPGPENVAQNDHGHQSYQQQNQHPHHTVSPSPSPTKSSKPCDHRQSIDSRRQ